MYVHTFYITWRDIPILKRNRNRFWRKNAKKMSFFSYDLSNTNSNSNGSNLLVKMPLSFFLLFFLFASFQGVCSASRHHGMIKPLPEELWSRKEMVEMAGYGEAKLSSVVVTGSLLCDDACLHGDHQRRSWPIPGASVAVKCHALDKRRSALVRAVTDGYGEFNIDLPSHLHGIANLEKACLVKVLHVPKHTKCQPAYAKKQRGLRLSSVGNGIRAYTAGRIRFQNFSSRSSQECIKKSSM